MLESVSAVLGAVMPFILIVSGICLGAENGFFYIFHPKRTIRLMFSGSGDGISPIKAASMALAGTLGVGNITGVTAAIAAGGAGAVFWMWISAFIAMSVKYAETVLAVIHRRHDGEGFYGGAPYYISDGLSKFRFLKRSGAFFAVLCIINSFTVGNILQVNAAASSAEYSFGVPRILTGITVAVLAVISVFGGAKRISSLTFRIVPTVSFIYIIMCAAVIFSGAEFLPLIIQKIFSEAFSLRAAAGGIGGCVMSQAIRYGITRGILTNEAGSGTSPTAHACADTPSPTSQGCLGIFEVFADTIVICSLTAFAVLTGKEYGFSLSADNTIASVFEIFEYFIGSAAPVMLTASIFVFVFATLISQYYYGEVALKFLDPNKKAGAERIYMLAFAASSVYGAVIAPDIMWQLSDITVCVMTAVNVLCLLLMHTEVKEETAATFHRAK